MASSMIPASVLAELRGLSAATLDATAYVYAPIRGRAPGGVTLEAWGLTAQYPCRLSLPKGSLPVEAAQETSTLEAALVLPAGTELPVAARVLVVGSTNGVTWRRELRLGGADAPGSFEVRRRVPVIGFNRLGDVLGYAWANGDLFSDGSVFGDGSFLLT